MSDEVVEDLAPSAATRSLATRRCARPAARATARPSSGRCRHSQVRSEARKIRARPSEPRRSHRRSGNLLKDTMRKRVVAVGLVGGLVAAGALVLFDRHRPPPPPAGTIAYSAPDLRDVLVARADGSGVHRLTSAPGPQFDPSFSPDGR